MKILVTNGKLNKASARVEYPFESEGDKNSTISPELISIWSATNFIVLGLGVISA
jgi:hypothetical protein